MYFWVMGNVVWVDKFWEGVDMEWLCKLDKIYEFDLRFMCGVINIYLF